MAMGWLSTGCCCGAASGAASSGSGSGSSSGVPRLPRSSGGGSAMMRGEEASEPALEGMRELGGATMRSRAACRCSCVLP